MTDIRRRISTNGKLYRVERELFSGGWIPYSSNYNNYEQAQKALLRLQEEDKVEEEWKPVVGENENG